MTMAASCSSTTPDSSGDTTSHQQQQQHCCSSVWRGSAFLALFLTLFLLAAQPHWSPPHNSSSSGSKDNNNSTAFRLFSNNRHHHPALPNKSMQRRRRRHRLILHVGPSKSATTSLQTDLTALQPALLLDGYAYAGRYYAPYVHPSTHKLKLGRSQSPLLATAHNMLKQCNLRGDDQRWKCCVEFVRELNAYARQHRVDRVILSEEPFGNQWRHPEDWRAIQRALLEESSRSQSSSNNHNNSTNTTAAKFDWEVTVVVGYRHFYAWLPSALFQHERVDRLRPVWPNGAAAKGGGGGRAVRPSTPTAATRPNWNKKQQHTSGILDAIGDTTFGNGGGGGVRLLNLHNAAHRSPLQLLLCDVLEDDAPAACRAARERERTANRTVLNAAGAVPSAFYDAIATAAAAETANATSSSTAIRLINTSSHTRTAVRDAVQERHETDRGLGPYDLPLTCPPDTVLDQLWQTSRALERRCLMAESSQRGGSGLDKQHRAGFEQYVARHKYCFVDTDAVLRDPDWRTFLQERFGK